MILKEEVDILKARAKFDEMVAMINKAVTAAERIDLVEKDLWERLLQLGHTLLRGYVNAHGTGDLGPTLEYEGQQLNRLDELYYRRYVSIFGELLIGRMAYGTRATQKLQVIPLDSRLGLPESEFSNLLQDWDQSLCVQGSYSESRQTVQRILGMRQTIGSLETMSQKMAQEVPQFFAEQPALTPAPEDSIIVLTADHKGVVMRRDAENDEPAPKGRLGKGQKRNKKKMACVGGVYDVAPFVRTAEDVVDELMREKKQSERPKPQNKRLRAELTQRLEDEEIKGTEFIFPWFSQELSMRDPEGRRQVVCVMDGEAKLWRILQSMFVSVICILDIFHVLERLWTVAHCFYPEGSDEAKEFVAIRLQHLLEGKVGYVIGGIRQIATKRGLKGNKKKTLFKALTYFENHRQFMKYDEYLAAGYPIGSGVVEGACRHLVKDRMEQSGMRWRISGAQAILHLRAIHLNGDWERFQEYRIEKECRQLYRYRDFVNAQWPQVEAVAA